jgi:predicted nucleic acid-binding protein
MLSWSHYSSEEIEKDAEKVLRKYFDQDFSYTDAISFAIMKRYKMGKSFSFDKHFVTAGFVNIPP